MAYNDKRLKTDLEGKPIPQAYNPDIDDYEPVHSTNNALKQVIYGPNGQPISTVGNKLAVKATELEALMQGLATEGKLEQVRQLLSGVATENKLEQARVLLNTISTKDFATQTTLAAVLAKLGQLETEIQAVKANQLSGDQKVQLSGTIATLETIINAQSVPPEGDTGMIQVPTLGCKRMLFLVNCDKEWKSTTNMLVTNTGAEANHIYPDRWTSNQPPVTSNNYPAEIVVGYQIADAANLNEALRWGILWHNVRVRISNVSAETATVTVRVIRFWEV